MCVGPEISPGTITGNCKNIFTAALMTSYLYPTARLVVNASPPADPRAPWVGVYPTLKMCRGRAAADVRHKPAGELGVPHRPPRSPSGLRSGRPRSGTGPSRPFRSHTEQFGPRPHWFHSRLCIYTNWNRQRSRASDGTCQHLLWQHQRRAKRRNTWQGGNGPVSGSPRSWGSAGARLRYSCRRHQQHQLKEKAFGKQKPRKHRCQRASKAADGRRRCSHARPSFPPPVTH